MSGCDRFKDDICFITAHDPATGRELWKASTIARPGEPGGETWGDRPLMYRAGGDAWLPGGYDPATNLIYWSTAQAKPWAQFQRGDAGSELYTNSTLALDPETGKVVWFRQFIPGDSYDQDEAYESILIDNRDEEANGAGETSITVIAAAIGNGIFDATGARIRQIPFTPERVKAALS